MSARITINLVEDDAETRNLLRRSLARQPDFAVLKVFANAEAALAHLTALAQFPDQLPGLARYREDVMWTCDRCLHQRGSECL